MPGRRREIFTTIHTEGGLLPSDFLQRLAEGPTSIPGLTPEAYHLTGGEKLNEAASRSWNRLQGTWASFQSASSGLSDSEPGTSVTREKWLLPLFQELGYGRLVAAKAFEIEAKSYPVSHLWHRSPIHLVGRNVDLDKRSPGVAGAARTSPHGLVQELLNRSDDHVWGFVSNGHTLRILRDNKSLTRQAYVEFDLAGMMEGQVYSDFAVLWLLCHESRVEAEKPLECWLEKWSETAREQGTRALEDLRVGVEKAIEALGRGFLAHGANASLKENLQKGTLLKQDYYRELLRTVYRLIFLFVAEDRGLLLVSARGSTPTERYTRHYSMGRLRALAEKRRGSPHADLWRALRLVFEKLGSAAGCPELGLPALGSFLWSPKAAPALDSCELSNASLLEAVRSLAFTIDRGIRHGIDYKNLGPEELGSVYESLLELHPDINADAATFALATAAGHERKTTGSYYTPTSLIECLLDSALDPVLDDAAKKPDPEKAILNLKVCDPACGSGHFLIAAAHRMARRLASVRTGDEEPSPDAIRVALRDVIGHCLYGVDVNPMAVELCKVNLWIEALVAGKPLSFLESRILCGNSLLGATPALLEGGIPDEAFTPLTGDDKDLVKALRKRNRAEHEGQLKLPLLAAETPPSFGALADAFTRIAETPDDTLAHVQEKEKTWIRLLASTEYTWERLLADAWCAAFVWRKARGAPPAITQDVFLRLQKDPEVVPRSVREEIARITQAYRFFHWHVGFPEVFALPGESGEPENALTGWNGGFDVVLGNPPWIRQELIESRPKNLLRIYSSFSSSADLSVFFVNLSVIIVRIAGRIGLLTPNKWLRAEYGRSLRSFLRRFARLHLVVDFGHSRTLFPAADTFPILFVAESTTRSPADDMTFLFTTATDSERTARDLPTLIAEALRVPHANLRSDGWRLEDTAVTELLDRVLRDSIPLEQYLGKSPLFGIKTGANEAFCIDTRTRELLLERDPSSGELFRKFLRGRDVERWACRWAGWWLISIASSNNRTWPWSRQSNEAEAEALFANEYPWVHAHLKKYEERLRARSDQGVFWWELRSCDYYDVFERPKIIVGDMAWRSQFSIDDSGALTADTTYVIPSNDEFVLGILNSRLLWWIFYRVAQPAKDGARRYRGVLGDLPMPSSCNETVQARITQCVRALMDARRDGLDAQAMIVYERKLNDLVQDAFELSPMERELLVRTLPPRDPLQEFESGIQDSQLPVET